MSDQDLNRRQFGKQAVAAAGAGIVANHARAADESPHSPAVAEPIPPASIPLDVLLLEVIRQRHPDRNLTHQLLGEVSRDIRSELRRAEAIRKVPLTNADEPATLFAVFRNEEAGDAS